MSRPIIITVPAPSLTSIADNISNEIVTPLILNNQTLPIRMGYPAIFNLDEMVNGNVLEYTVVGFDNMGNPLSQVLNVEGIGIIGTNTTENPYAQITSVFCSNDTQSTDFVENVCVGLLDSVASIQDVWINDDNVGTVALKGAVGNYTYAGSAANVDITNNMFVMPDGLIHFLVIAFRPNVPEFNLEISGFDADGNPLTESLTIVGEGSDAPWEWGMSENQYYIVSSITIAMSVNTLISDIGVGIIDLVASSQNFEVTDFVGPPLTLSSDQFNMWQGWWTPIIVSPDNNQNARFIITYKNAPSNNITIAILAGPQAGNFVLNPNILASEIISIECTTANISNIAIGVADYAINSITTDGANIQLPLQSSAPIILDTDYAVLFSSSQNQNNISLTIEGSVLIGTYNVSSAANFYETSGFHTFQQINGIALFGSTTNQLSVGFHEYFVSNTTFVNSSLIPLSYPIALGANTLLVFTSGDQDNSTTNFVITGTDIYSQVVTETIVGPADNASVSSVNLYFTITSITVDNFYTNLSIGTGGVANSHWVPLDFDREINQTTIQVISTDDTEYSVFQTLDPLQSYNAQSVLVVNTAPVLYPIDSLNAVSGNMFATNIPVASAVQLQVTENDSRTTDITFTINQQGE